MVHPPLFTNSTNFYSFTNFYHFYQLLPLFTDFYHFLPTFTTSSNFYQFLTTFKSFREKEDIFRKKSIREKRYFSGKKAFGKKKDFSGKTRFFGKKNAMQFPKDGQKNNLLEHIMIQKIPTLMPFFPIIINVKIWNKIINIK